MNDELFGIRDILGFVPYIGDALDIADVSKDISKGNYGKAAIGLGLLAVPNIIEKPLKLVGRKAIRKLSDAEKLGIPKGERKSPSPYQQIGTAVEPKSRKEHITVDSPMFGDYIDSGGQQSVFNSANNSDKVLKVYTDRKFTSIPEIREFHKQWMKRNRLPIQERIKFQGYLQGNGRIYPVYEQNKVNPLGDMPMTTWEKDYIPQINEQMLKIGYKGNGTYTNGWLNVGDVNPWNIGYNKNGELRFFDADVFKLGGRIIFRNVQ